jgi:Relaxase/Mobilisation nuclease domain
MIVHVIERDKKKSGKAPKSSYKRLAHYIVAAKSEQDEILWQRTAEYIMAMRETTDGEKVLWTRLTNCDAEIPLLAIAEIEATQAQNTRSKADKTYHMVVSFRENENPTRAQIEAIEDAICEGLGFVGHQRISAVHQDTDNLHLHIAVNKVHPQRLTVHEPYYPYLKIDSLCKQLEREHGLFTLLGNYFFCPNFWDSLNKLFQVLDILSDNDLESPYKTISIAIFTIT